MAFTGDLEQLHIVDIIQLLNTTRKSGVFSVKGSKGESRIIFSNGYIVGASHLNKVRIGTILVKTGAITLEDLNEALETQKNAKKDRKPLIAMLIDLGKLGQDEAFKCLRKLIEITIVELIGWTKGTFTVDTDIITVSPECSYPLSRMEEEISLDAQMILMDGMRIFDARERDRQAGKPVPSDEELFADVISSEGPLRTAELSPVLSADDLGLGDLHHLERKIPQFFPIAEIFDPVEIHRHKIKETLADFPVEEQESFVSFLEKSTSSLDAHDGSIRQMRRAKAFIMFSGDELIRHSLMTICKNEDVLVFATVEEEELYSIIDQCLGIKVLPIVVFDNPETPEKILSREAIVRLRLKVKEKYQQVSIIQMASLADYAFALQSFHDGVRAVFPKPSKEVQKTTFIRDMINFLETFKSYIKGLFEEQRDLTAQDDQLGRLKDRVLALRALNEPADLSVALLRHVSEVCERSITFIVRPAELIGEKAIGVYAEKNAGPTSVTGLKVPLSKSSVFHNVIEKGQLFYGAAADEVFRKHLFELIGEPLSQTIILLPVKI